MNRAWIPAGVLASVSVAGLIALGPLTDSLQKPVSFSSVVTVPQTAPAKRFVPVSASAGVVGNTKTKHASLDDVHRGGAAEAPTSGETGPVAVKISHNPPAVQAPVTTPRATTPAAPAKKKTNKPRPTSIGGSNGPNGDEGLASGGSSDGSGGGGAQSATPGADATP
jgi:hypothetical protein